MTNTEKPKYDMTRLEASRDPNHVPEPKPVGNGELTGKSFEEVFTLLQVRCKEFKFRRGDGIGEVFWEAIMVNGRREPELYHGHCIAYVHGTGVTDWTVLTKQLTDFYQHPENYR